MVQILAKFKQLTELFLKEFELSKQLSNALFYHNCAAAAKSLQFCPLCVIP